MSWVDSAQIRVQGGKKRSYPRFTPPVSPLGGFMSGDHRITGDVFKISPSGLYLMTQEPLRVGMLGKLGVTLPDWFFRVNAVVRSTEPSCGAGIEFVSMSSQDREALSSYCDFLRRLTQ